MLSANRTPTRTYARRGCREQREQREQGFRAAGFSNATGPLPRPLLAAASCGWQALWINRAARPQEYPSMLVPTAADLGEALVHNTAATGGDSGAHTRHRSGALAEVAAPRTDE